MIARRGLILLPLAALAGCAAPPPPPAVLHLTIKGAPDQNPDPSGHPAPVAVRLYQLAAPGRFTGAGVFALIDREAATLGAEALASEEIVLRPGQTLHLTRTLKPGTQFIGVAVLFRDIDRAHWRAVVPVAASGPTDLTLTVSGLSAALAASSGG